MEGLPDDVLLLILGEYLHVSELVRCRLVSKRIKFLVDNFVKIKKLVFETDQTHLVSRVDYSGLSFEASDKQANREFRNPNHIILIVRGSWTYGGKNTFYKRIFNLPRNSSFQLLCSNLKYLQFADIFHFTESNTAALNELTKLEQLFIKEPQIPLTNRRPELNLPNLQLLSICWVDETMDRKRLKLVVNSKIKKLVFFDGFAGAEPRTDEISPIIELKHPEHLEFLKIFNLEISNLSLFQKLRVLHCDRIADSNHNIVELLRNLEEISLQPFDLEKSQTKRTANHLMRQRLKRPKLKIYFYGIRLDQPFEDYHFEEFSLKNSSLAVMHLHHYGQLTKHFPYIKEVDYRELVGQLEHLAVCKMLPLDSAGLPVDFFARTNIQRINILEIRNSHQLAAFLKQCKGVRDLCFYYEAISKLEQSIVDLISDLYALSLNHLSLIVGHNADLDFRPFLRLKQLITLEVEHLNLNLVLDLFGNFRNLTRVHTTTNCKNLIFFTKKRGKYKVKWNLDGSPEDANYVNDKGVIEEGIYNTRTLIFKDLTYEELKKIVIDRW